MEKLYTKENKIVNESGKEVLLKGININSPGILKYQENHDFLNDLKEIKNLGANALRIPVSPAYFQSKENYFEEILDPIVELSNKLEMYCLIDWHAQGNPSKNITRDDGKDLIEGFEKYDAKKELALDFLEKASKRYGKEKNILYDIFSMPIDINSNDWVETSTELINKVRENSDSIIIVNGIDWSSDLEWALKTPINSENIAYGITYYPMVSDERLEISKKVKEKFPLIFSECGFTKEGYFKEVEDYRKKLKESISEDNISFFAWAYHPKRVPVLLNSWDPKDLTEWGNFLKDNLLNSEGEKK